MTAGKGIAMVSFSFLLLYILCFAEPVDNLPGDVLPEASAQEQQDAEAGWESGIWDQWESDQIAAGLEQDVIAVEPEAPAQQERDETFQELLDSAPEDKEKKKKQKTQKPIPAASASELPSTPEVSPDETINEEPQRGFSLRRLLIGVSLAAAGAIAGYLFLHRKDGIK